MTRQYFPTVTEPHLCSICGKKGATHRTSKGDYIHILCGERLAKKYDKEQKAKR